ncbi:MAG: FHA domain-containing protein [FCB group bacterium]|jgi:hypothetical protein|nr:FHA domain-containing protein [FCB group bacterium]
MTVSTDCLVVVNGPEDGTEFPIVRAPFEVGRASDCAACVTLDAAVRPQHARVWAVSDGYRVRRATHCAVYVDGKRAGRFRSRILREGGTLQVGHTLLALQCAPDGLAGRSHGLVLHSDTACFAHWCAGKAIEVAGGAGGTGIKLLRGLVRNKLVLVALLGVLYLFWPAFHHTVNGYAALAWRRVSELFSSLP